MTVTELYEAIHGIGLVGSQVEFSRVWLGRSSRYYSNLVAVQREPGVGTLCGVVWRIETIAAHVSRAKRGTLLEIKQRLDREIVSRALARQMVSSHLSS